MHQHGPGTSKSDGLRDFTQFVFYFGTDGAKLDAIFCADGKHAGTDFHRVKRLIQGELPMVDRAVVILRETETL